MNLHHPSYSLDLNQAQQQQLYDHQILLHRHTFSNLQPHSSPSSSSSPIYSNPLQDDQLRYLYVGSQLQSSPYQQEVDDKTIPYANGGSYDQTTLEMKGAKRTNLKFTICKQEEQSSDGREEINGSNVKWMPLRIMKKMMRRDEDNLKHQPPYVHVEDETNHLMSKTSVNNNNNNDTAIRVCSDCNTTKTPLWRSGPRGPKSLCNACGIRQRKARRAMAMATNGSMPSSVMKVGNGHKKSANNNNTFGGQKKRSKVIKPSRDSHHHYDAQRKLWFEQFASKLSKKLTIQQVFPQEEKEAAMLLMALSCGFVHG